MASWRSLFLPCDDAEVVTDTIRESLRMLGYTPFNPFGTMPGLSYPQAVRLFVAPSRAGWTRVIGELDRAQLPIISRSHPCLLVMLDGDQSIIEMHSDGQRQTLDSALVPYLKPDVTHEMLQHALTRKAAPTHSEPPDMELLRDALPEDIKGMRVDMRQAQKMFDRLSGGLTQRSGNTGNEAAARDLLRGDKLDWNSAGGVQIRAVMDCLTIPAGWQSPDFVTLRDAYQLHERKRRLPNATLYPGDAEAMAAVPDALDYTVVYAGKG